MKSVNSLSGGKTSSYMAVHYPTDYNIFALVRTNDQRCKFPDDKVRQRISDKLGVEFVGTLEMDEIIYTMLDLEQMIGRKITWVTGETYEDLLIMPENNLLPSPIRRYCTALLKNMPIFHYWLSNIKEQVVTNIGFRANEQNRANNVLAKCVDGLLGERHVIGHSPSGNRKWKTTYYSKPNFPLISDGVFKDQVEVFWSDKTVRFAELNNCVGCFHRHPILLNKLFISHPNKMSFFLDLEKNRKYANDTLKADSKLSYDKIKDYKLQMELGFDEFSECDSGYCGI